LNFFDVVLWPLKWVIEAIIVSAHNFLTLLGLDPVFGVTWMLSIAILVVFVRAAMIPLFLHQMRTAKKYNGKIDAESRAAQSAELIALYKEAGTSPGAFLVPVLIQAPIFLSLFAVLNHAARQGTAGVGWFTDRLAGEFNEATIFGASLHDSFSSAVVDNITATLILVPVIIAVMILAQYLTLRWSTDGSNRKSNGMRLQYGALILFSGVFVFSGTAFPLSLLLYMLFSTLWTTVQQFIYLLWERRAAKAVADTVEDVDVV
jgi:YidC/Oxa1 family membrane protein insertase